MNAALVQALLARANGKCECCGEGCGVGIFARLTIDHFFSRSRAPEDLEHLWVLRADHHRAKTDSEPTAAHWVQKFISHQLRHGYDATRAQNKLTYLLAKKGLSEAARKQREQQLERLDELAARARGIQ